MRGGVTIRVSREHAKLLEEVKQRFCYPTFTSASQWLTKQVRESGLMENKKEEVPKFRLRI